ncbi:hypothetical protein ACJMK2_036528 [Sinanodonta woodiana]|uniref:Uncharacterized protein n=1 Tax=Sinanodonta woodiana TaxID=1069815 RepID=A0ABD3WIV6_SINWO
MLVADEVEVEGGMIASGQPRIKAVPHNLMEFTDAEILEYDEELNLEQMQPPEAKSSFKEREMEIRHKEFEWEMEREKLRLEIKRLEIDLENVEKK